MATRCHKCRDLTGQCQDCWQADNGVIRYSDPPPPQDVVTFHGPQFGVSQTQHDAVVAERDALKAEVFQAKAIAEHWQKRTEQTEKERAAFRDDAKRLREALEPLVVVAEAFFPLVELAPKIGLANKCAYLRSHIDKALAALKQERGDEPIRMPCAHNWVTASDAYITGTEICTKCGGLRAPRGG